MNYQRIRYGRALDVSTLLHCLLKQAYRLIFDWNWLIYRMNSLDCVKSKQYLNKELESSASILLIDTKQIYAFNCKKINMAGPNGYGWHRLLDHEMG